jgi:hypothetical protein
MRILVAGANGLTGTRVVRQLMDSGHEPVAMIRDPAQERKFREIGTQAVVADLEENLDHAVEGMDGIVFAAGSGSKTGPDKTVDVDRNGAIRLIDTRVRDAERDGDDGSGGEPDRALPPGQARCGRAPGEFGRLDVRPGRLTNEDRTGRIDAATSLGRRGEIPRDDVAAVLVRCFDLPSVRGRNFEILSGETPIDEALRAL